MPSFLHTLLIVALISFVLAAPFPEQIQKRSFKIDRVANPNFKREVGHKRAAGAGSRALVRAYRKYGMPVPEALAAITANAPVNANAPTKASRDLSISKDVLLALISEILSRRKGKEGGRPAKTQSAGVAAATGAPATGDSTAAAVDNNTGEIGRVVAIPTPGDTEYISPVNIGGQTINVDFDSGSSDFWVFNTELAANAQVGHQNYDPSKSNTFKSIPGATFSISYGDGSGAAGIVGTDTVDIGGATVTGQAIELATAVSQSFIQDTNSNGLLGLAFSKLNTVRPQQQKTFFDNALATLAEPVFTADLRKAAAGSYEFGAIDSTKFDGELQWVGVNATSGFWQVSAEKVIVGRTTTNLPGGIAIADTGTTLMLVDPSIVNAYYSQVQGAVNNEAVGGVTFPCNANLPDIQVDMGGAFLSTVRGEHINFAPVDQAGTICFGGIQAIAPPLQIYGDIFFKSNFVAFHAGNNSLGIAPHQ